MHCGRSDAKHALATVEAAIGYQDMAVGIDWGQISNLSLIAEGLDGDDCAGDGILLRYCLLEEDLQGLPGATAKIGKVRQLSGVTQVFLTLEASADANNHPGFGDVDVRCLPRFRRHWKGLIA